MTDAIQHNAANILALSIALFTSAVAAPDKQFLARIAELPKDASPTQPSSSTLKPSLATA